MNTGVNWVIQFLPAAFKISLISTKKFDIFKGKHLGLGTILKCNEMIRKVEIHLKENKK